MVTRISGDQTIFQGPVERRELAIIARLASISRNLFGQGEQTATVREVSEKNILDTTYPIFATDSEGRIIFTNAPARRLTGKFNEQLVGQPIQLIFQSVKEGSHPFFNEIVLSCLKEKMEGITVNSECKVGDQIGNYEVFMAEGKSDGSSFFTLAIQNASAQKKFEGITDRWFKGFYASYSETGEFLAVSPNVEGILGYTPEELIGTNRYSLTLPEDLLETQLSYSKMAERGEENDQTPTILPFRYKAKDGTTVPVIQYGFGSNKNGEFNCVIRLDSSQRRESDSEVIEKLIHADQSRKEFLAYLCHEIRNPLSVILFMLEGIKNKTLSKEEVEGVLEAFKGDLKEDEVLSALIEKTSNLFKKQIKYQKSIQKKRAIIEESSEQILDIVNQALDESMVEENKYTINKKEYNVVVLVESVIKVLKRSAKIKEIKLKHIFKKGLKSLQYGDPENIRKVLVKLITNAINFTTEGEVVVSVESVEVENTLKTSFSVQDTGSGISNADINKLFEKHLSLSQDSATEGSGIGLYLSQKLVELMGGTMSVESELGKGSTFSFSLIEELPVCSPPTSINTPLKVTKKRVLILEDELITRKTLIKRLNGLGYDCDAVSNGEEGIAMLLDHDYDLFFSDMNMPRMNGAEFKKSLRGTKHESTPFLLGTAGVTESEIKRYLELGFDRKDILSKPYLTDDLKRIMAEKLPESSTESVAK
ncbi:ATP-binding protein [Chlamydiales bacterium]|nr:ATP-binding protein [Chlamydiales bacterium]